MSFVFTAALWIGLLVAIPIVAHLLRRGRARATPFPATRLVPKEEHVARRRSRFEDRWLLVTRAAILFALALLGAIPLARCDRAVFVRQQGASVAAMIIFDDSGSMRNRLPSGLSRFSRAKRAVFELIDQSREGDSIGLVLAGKPARMLLLPTANRPLLRQQLDLATESDRSTDLVSAIALAESALDRQPHVDKQLIVLSDLAGELPKRVSSRISTMLPELTGPLRNCGILSALRERGQVAVEIACSDAHPSVERRLQLIRESQPKQVVREKAVGVHPGRDVFTLEDRDANAPSLLRLAGSDDNPHDDTAPVIDGGLGPAVATYSDPTVGRGSTGGPPIIEQALRAIHATLSIRPLATVPEDARELSGANLLLLDDPPLLSAEARMTVTDFVNRGGIAVAFLGATANLAQLGSLLLPFVERRAVWESPALSAGLDPTGLANLGASAASFTDIAPKGRLLFDESHDRTVVVKGRWADQKPFWIERPLGRGVVVTFGLPTSVEQSDLSLRTGFVATLIQLLAKCERLGMARVVTAGSAWRISTKGAMRVDGPSGPLPPHDSPEVDITERVIVPSSIGRYRMWFDGQSEERFALLPPEEVLEPPRPLPGDALSMPSRTTGRLDLSRYSVMVLVGLLAVELVLGSVGPRRLMGRLWRWLGQNLLGPGLWQVVQVAAARVRGRSTKTHRK